MTIKMCNKIDIIGVNDKSAAGGEYDASGPLYDSVLPKNMANTVMRKRSIHKN